MLKNIELAERILEQVTEHPETHDQEHYGYQGCGTTHCIAGWAVVLTPEVELNWESGLLHSVWLPEDRWMTPFEAGQELLALELEEAQKLFLGVDPYDKGDEDEKLDGGGTNAAAVAYLRELIADARAVAS